MRTFSAKERAPLLEFLFKALADTKKTRVRQSLKFGAVSVNGVVTTRFDHALLPGDKVAVKSSKEANATSRTSLGIKVVFEDDAILVIEKPAGLLTVASETVSHRTAFYAANEYACLSAEKDHRGGRYPEEKRKLGKRIFIVHRLDREASGLLVFAKDAEIKESLQSGWKDVRKKYYAVVEGTPKEPAGTLTSYLRENKFLKVYSTQNAEAARLSTTRYKVLRSSGGRSLLEVELETGRKHQIRVHLSDIGCPIVGDDRYGSTADPAERLALHAYSLAMKHPVSGKEMVFRSPMPGVFEKILAGGEIRPVTRTGPSDPPPEDKGSERGSIARTQPRSR